MSKLGKIGIGVVIILALGVISLLPVFPVTVSYQVVEFVREGWPRFLDWELEYVVTIENVSAVGGTFTVVANFYDGHRLVYTTMDRKFIGPGELATFTLWSHGLGWSTDWKIRYTVRPEIRAPTEHVNLIRLLAGE